MLEMLESSKLELTLSVFVCAPEQNLSTALVFVIFSASTIYIRGIEDDEISYNLAA